MSKTDTIVVTTKINAALKAKLEALARNTKRSKSFLAAEAIATYIEVNESQIDEITAGLEELDSGAALSEKLAGCCSQSDASPARICAPLFSPARRHLRAHCRR